MSGKKLVPKRRFEDFDDEWKLNRLDDLGHFGKTYAYSRAKEGDGEYHHIHYGDIHVKYNGFITRKTQVPSVSVQGDFELLKDDDIVIADASEDYIDLGKTAIIQRIENKKMIAGLHTFKFTPNENLNSVFYLYYSQTNLFKNFSYKTGTGISVFGISKENIRKMELNLPNSKEQQKIGNFFKHLDQMISLEQLKFEKTKALKSAYLAEMFPTEGERVPKRRFVGFQDEWQECKLEDLAEIVRGASPRPIQDPKWFDMNSQIGWLRIADVTEQNGRINYLKQRLSILGQEKTRVLNEPHLLLSIAATVGKPVVNYVETGVHDGFLIFINPKFDLEFMFQWLEMFRPMWNKYGQPGSQVNLNSDIVKSQIVAIPSIEEQEIISKFFKKLDDQITNQQQKLNKLKAMKQAYLEEMFV